LLALVIVGLRLHLLTISSIHALAQNRFAFDHFEKIVASLMSYRLVSRIIGGNLNFFLRMPINILGSRMSSDTAASIFLVLVTAQLLCLLSRRLGLSSRLVLGMWNTIIKAGQLLCPLLLGFGCKCAIRMP
jgi:uncharacterized membrane-anchored protein